MDRDSVFDAEVILEVITFRFMSKRHFKPASCSAAQGVPEWLAASLVHHFCTLPKAIAR